MSAVLVLYLSKQSEHFVHHCVQTDGIIKIYNKSLTVIKWKIAGVITGVIVTAASEGEWLENHPEKQEPDKYGQARCRTVLWPEWLVAQ